MGYWTKKASCLYVFFFGVGGGPYVLFYLKRKMKSKHTSTCNVSEIFIFPSLSNLLTFWTKKYNKK